MGRLVLCTIYPHGATQAGSTSSQIVASPSVTTKSCESRQHAMLELKNAASVMDRQPRLGARVKTQFIVNIGFCTCIRLTMKDDQISRFRLRRSSPSNHLAQLLTSCFSQLPWAAVWPSLLVEVAIFSMHLSRWHLARSINSFRSGVSSGRSPGREFGHRCWW